MKWQRLHCNAQLACVGSGETAAATKPPCNWGKGMDRGQEGKCRVTEGRGRSFSRGKSEEKSVGRAAQGYYITQWGLFQGK